MFWFLHLLIQIHVLKIAYSVTCSSYYSFRSWCVASFSIRQDCIVMFQSLKKTSFAYSNYVSQLTLWWERMTIFYGKEMLWRVCSVTVWCFRILNELLDDRVTPVPCFCQSYEICSIKNCLCSNFWFIWTMSMCWKQPFLGIKAGTHMEIAV